MEELLARTKQVAPCLFCSSIPCQCVGQKKERKPRAKKASAPAARPKDSSPIPAAEPVSQDEGTVSPDEDLVLDEPVVPDFPSASGRKRARFARASKGDPVPQESAPDPVGLPMDPTSVAIRTLALADMLPPSELHKHRDAIVPPRPTELDRRLSDWRSRRET